MNRIYSENEILDIIFKIGRFNTEAGDVLQKVQARQKQQTEEQLQQYKLEKDKINQEAKALEEEVIQRVEEVKAQIRKEEQSMFTSIQLLSQKDPYFDRTYMDLRYGLVNETTHEYDHINDVSVRMEMIKKDFSNLISGYLQMKMGKLFNTIDYLVSPNRGKDYRRIVELYLTACELNKSADKYTEEFKNENLQKLKDITEKRLKNLEDRLSLNCDTIIKRSESDVEDLKKQFDAYLNSVLDPEKINNILNYTKARKQAHEEPNSSREMSPLGLFGCDIYFPFISAAKVPAVREILKEHLKKLTSKESLKLPFVHTMQSPYPWYIIEDNSNKLLALAVVQRMIYDMIAAVPVGRLVVDVLDSAAGGDSLSAFYELRTRIPGLFGKEICSNPEACTVRLNDLAKLVETRSRLLEESGCTSVYEHAKKTGKELEPIHLLVIFDFPAGMNEQKLEKLERIVARGASCGVHIILSGQEKTDSLSAGAKKRIEELMKRCVKIRQMKQMFVYDGLPVIPEMMPAERALEGFAEKYILFSEASGKDQSTPLGSLFNLMKEEDPDRVKEEIEELQKEIDKYHESKVQILPAESKFPPKVVIGELEVPPVLLDRKDMWSREESADMVRSALMNTPGNSLVMPLHVNLCENSGVYLEYTEDSREQMTAFSHQLIWSFLKEMPATKLKLCVFDSKRRGDSIRPLLKFTKDCEKVCGGGIVTGREEINTRLRRLNSFIDEIIQQKLGGRYKNLLEYNEHAARRTEPFTLLVIYDFPEGMDAQSQELLLDVISNGGKCGIYTVICAQKNASAGESYQSTKELVQKIARRCLNIHSVNGRYCLKKGNLPVSTVNFPENDIFEEFTGQYKKAVSKAGEKGIDVSEIVPEKLFERSASSKLEIPIGIGDEDAVVSLRIGEGVSQHGLIAGATGSGKSVLLHDIILSSMMHYSPDELQLYLMDFKGGTEFKIYENIKIPHIQLLAIDAMQEFGESILEKLKQEIEDRSRLFKETGSKNLADYRRLSGRTLPRILVVIDEFQVLYNESTNRNVAQNCAALTKTIVTQGRSYGIHLLMATQTIAGISELALDQSTVEEMRIRIGLQCSESDARHLFPAGNDAKACRLMRGPAGTAVLSLNYAEPDMSGFRAANCNTVQQEKYLQQLQEALSGKYQELIDSRRVFECGRDTGFITFCKTENITLQEGRQGIIWLGEPVKVADPVTISLGKKARHNLLVCCGGKAFMENRIMSEYLISAVLNKRANVYCVDGGVWVGEEEAEDFYDVLADCCDRFRVINTRGALIELLREFYEKYAKAKRTGSSELNIIVLRNFQYLDIVQTMMKGESVQEDEYLEETEDDFFDSGADVDPSDPFADVFGSISPEKGTSVHKNSTEILRKLLNDGYSYGFHFALSSLDFQPIKDCMYYGESALARFPDRILYSLGEADSGILADGVSLQNMPENIVCYADGVKNPCQIKPYLAPGIDELKEYLQSLDSRKETD